MPAPQLTCAEDPEPEGAWCCPSGNYLEAPRDHDGGVALGRNLTQHFEGGPGASTHSCAELCRPWEAQARPVSSLVQYLPPSAPLQSRGHGLGNMWVSGLGSTLLSGFFIYREDRSVDTCSLPPICPTSLAS